MALRLVLAIAAAALAACGSQQVILPGKLDLAVAQGGSLKLCPDDGVADTTPDADCVLGAPVNAFAPYAEALTAKGWTEEEGVLQDSRVWTSPEAGGQRNCLAIASYQTNVGGRDRTLLAFHFIDPARNPNLVCPPKEAS